MGQGHHGWRMGLELRCGAVVWLEDKGWRWTTGQWHGRGAFRKAVGQGLEKGKGTSIVSEAVGLGLKVGLGHGAPGKAVGQGLERSQGALHKAVGQGLETGYGAGTTL